MYQTILTARKEHLAQITLNRPRLHNAFNDTLVAELTRALEQADHDDSVHAVVITGTGQSFCAGADTGWMRNMAQASKLDNKEDSLRLARLMRVLNFLSKPTIARVNGSAYGGGIGLIACCDIAIGVEDARFALSEVKLGLVPAVISPYVVRAIGGRQARRLFITAQSIDAAEAQRIGLLHVCVDAEQLDAAMAREIELMAHTAPLARRDAKRLALHMGGMEEPAQMRIDAQHAEWIARLRVSEEGQEGLCAFLEKRAPAWITEASP